MMIQVVLFFLVIFIFITSIYFIDQQPSTPVLLSRPRKYPLNPLTHAFTDRVTDIHTNVHTHKYTNQYTTPITNIHTHVETRPYTNIHTNKHTNPLTHVHTNIHTNPLTHVHTNPLTHVHTHVHTNPLTHVHTDSLTNPLTHVHTDSLTNPSTHVHTNPSTHVHTNPSTHVHTNPSTHVHTNPSTHVHTNPSTHVHTNPSTHVHTNPSTHVHTNPSTHVHTNPSTHVHTNPSTHVHTNPSTHVHTNPTTLGATVFTNYSQDIYAVATSSSLTNPFQVILTLVSGGSPFVGQTISWAVTAGSASMGATTTSTTNSSGIASIPATFTTGTTNSTIVATFTYSGQTVTFYTKIQSVFATLANITSPGASVQGVAVVNGKFYMNGGQAPSGGGANWYIYDSVANSWSSGTNTPVTMWPASAIGVGTKVYVLGRNTSNNQTVFYMYDTVGNAWTTMTPMSTSNMGNTEFTSMIAVGTLIYAAGQNPVSGTGNYFGSFQTSGATSGTTWTSLTNLPLAPLSAVRGGICLGQNGNSIYAVGGIDNSSNSASGYNVYSISGNSWDAFTTLSGPTYGYGQSCGCGNNQVYYLFGYHSGVVQGTIYAFDMTALTLTTINPVSPSYTYFGNSVYYQYGIFIFGGYPNPPTSALVFYQ